VNVFGRIARIGLIAVVVASAAGCCVWPVGGRGHGGYYQGGYSQGGAPGGHEHGGEGNSRGYGQRGQ